MKLGCYESLYHPISISGATGVYVDDRIIICGGEYSYPLISNEIYTLTDRCYQLMKGAESFELLQYMEQERLYAKSIKFQEEMIVSGGRKDTDVYGTGEFIDSQHTIIQLPEGLYGHAFLNINESTSIIIGGKATVISNEYSKKTHYYNHYKKEWTSGPELNIGRAFHTAGVLVDHDSNQQHIAVIGGENFPFISLDSVELLRHGEGAWSKGTVINISKESEICLSI